MTKQQRPAAAAAAAATGKRIRSRPTTSSSRSSATMMMMRCHRSSSALVAFAMLLAMAMAIAMGTTSAFTTSPGTRAVSSSSSSRPRTTTVSTANCWWQNSPYDCYGGISGGSITSTALCMASRSTSRSDESSSLPSRGASSRIDGSLGEEQQQQQQQRRRRSRRQRKDKQKKVEAAAGEEESAEVAADNLSVLATKRSETPAPAAARSASSSASASAAASVLYQRTELLNHRLLTRDEEFDLGKRIQVAASLRERLKVMAEERREERRYVGIQNDRRRQQQYRRRYTPKEYRLLEEVVMEDEDDSHNDDDSSHLMSDWIAREGDDGAAEGLFLPSDEELFELGMSNSFSSSSSSSSSSLLDSYPLNPLRNAADADADADGEEEQLLLAQDSGFTILDQKAEEAAAADAAASMVAPPSAHVAVQEGGPFSMDAVERDLVELTEEDVINALGVGDGGRDELRRILLSGAAARRDLMRGNIRLVVSISKKWMKGSAGQYGSGGNLRELYAGGWDRPSLDEVIQEGILGLVRAVDKYDYGRGMRFATYATYWITSYVRDVFKTTKTGPLHVPKYLFDIATKHRRLMAKLSREDRPVPDVEEIAKDFGCSVKRLTSALIVTETLVSLDEPIRWMGGSKGSGAGEKGISEGEVKLADNLVCQELGPDELVELSFLRQTLENALAAELSPHERDVIRLRLGLDDGQSRTAKEVAAVCGNMIGPSEVRRAERSAFKKLSNPSTVSVHNLKDFLHVAGIGRLGDDYSFQPYR